MDGDVGFYSLMLGQTAGKVKILKVKSKEHRNSGNKEGMGVWQDLKCKQRGKGSQVHSV